MLVTVMKQHNPQTAKNNPNLQLYFQKGVKTTIWNIFVKDWKHTKVRHTEDGKNTFLRLNKLYF